METLKGFLLALFGLITAVVLSVLVLIKGWGLEPRSWWWIIGVGFFGQIVAQFILQIGVYKDK